MEYVNLGNGNISSSRLIYGCMRIAGDNSYESRKKGKRAIRKAIDEGFNHFDHADIYEKGICEDIFSDVMKEIPGLRDKLLITGKCGIISKNNPYKGNPMRYDFSKKHIIRSVEGSLSRLNVDYLDFLLLHRPDYLLNGEEVSETFQLLRESEKVRHFGVSNFCPSQVSLLQSYCSFPLLVNQVEINIHNISALLDGTLDQCEEMNIIPQAWSPLAGVAYPVWGNTFAKKDEIRIKKELEFQSKKYNSEDWIIMLAWLMRHPAKILPIIGSTTPSRIAAAKQSLDIDYSREDWYRLLEARNGYPVP